MLEYTLFIDVWLLRLICNFTFEYLLLWATAAVSGAGAKPYRLALASLLGTFHYLLYLLARLGLIPYYGLLRFLPVIVLLSFAMLIIAFFPLSIKRLFSVGAHFYGIGFLAAGAGLAAAYLLGDGQTPRFGLGTLFSVLTILLIAELGWGVIHKQIAKRMFRIPMQIACDNQLIHLQALVDTGNHLHDPLNRRPVIIVEEQALSQIIPPKIKEAIRALEKGDLKSLDRLGDLHSWQTRLRIIPFSSIGKKSGLLVGFRPDSVQIGRDFASLDFIPTIAIHPYALDPHGEYAALIPPALVEDSLDVAQQTFRQGGKPHANEPTQDL